MLPTEIPKNPPIVTARSWSIYNPLCKTFIGGKQENCRREVASLTKIMTCIVSIEIAEEEKVSLSTRVRVSKAAARIGGTSSKLMENDELRVIDLLYGLMLPSGNDSALVLAEYFGKFYHESLPTVGFIKVMNYTCGVLNLTNTFFQNPHGLSKRPNISSANDIGVLAAYALENKTFRQIVNTRAYTCEIFNDKGGTREVPWDNTNLLLGEGFDGVKTGTTGKAGPCLCVRIKNEACPFIVTVLNSQSSEDRWKDTSVLATWVNRHCIFK